MLFHFDDGVIYNNIIIEAMACVQGRHLPQFRAVAVAEVGLEFQIEVDTGVEVPVAVGDRCVLCIPLLIISIRLQPLYVHYYHPISFNLSVLHVCESL